MDIYYNKVFHSADNQNNLVSRLATRRRLAIGEDWSQDVHFGEQSELRYSYHVFCDEYYFGDGCADYCRPRDDTLGHYTCDEEGNRICLEGWKGNYCSERKSLFTYPRDQDSQIDGVFVYDTEMYKYYVYY